MIRVVPFNVDLLWQRHNVMEIPYMNAELPSNEACVFSVE
jgi:hypothetical protein